MLLGLVGVVVLANPDPSALLSANVIGKFLVFLAAVSFALGSVLTKYLDVTLPIETMEAWSMIVGAALMHAASIALGEQAGAVAWTMEGIAALLYLAVISSAFGFLIYFDLLERLGPIEINLVSYVSPVWAALAGWVALGETVDLTTVIGFAVIFTGFWLLKREALAGEITKLQRFLAS
jgi:drug/metabolite transporter (DMT)-like permease